MSIYEKLKVNEDGWSDWQRPIHEGYKLACCDCGLIHNMDFRVRGKNVEFRVQRNNRATGQRRRWDGIKVRKTYDE